MLKKIKQLKQLKKYKNYFDNYQGLCLDKEQRKIITYDGDMIVIAGAGSGKSLTISAKINYLLKENIKKEEILCLSFTNMACKALEKKLDGIEVLTYHKLALRILKNNGIFKEIVNEDLLNSIIIDNMDKNFPPYFEKTILTFINLFKSNNYSLNKFDEFLKQNEKEEEITKQKNKKLLLFIKMIYLKYQIYLEEHKMMDFNDIINESIKYIKKTTLNYKYIFIDEFQDSSLIKIKMIKEIKKYTKAKIICVGDDFQSIYRFTGSNIDIFLNFKKYFPHSKKYYLKNTYRNSQTLINIAGKFIMKNKKQIKKKLKSNKINFHPIYLVKEEQLKELFKTYNITTLGRNNKDIQNYKNAMTIHASKGLEFENTLIVGLTDKYNGFPNKIIEEDILKYVSNTKNTYPFEEERRIFYVALTRTKNNVFLLVPKTNKSIFLKEISRDKSIIML